MSKEESNKAIVEIRKLDLDCYKGAERAKHTNDRICTFHNVLHENGLVCEEELF
jgi:hypothetical protein